MIVFRENSFGSTSMLAGTSQELISVGLQRTPGKPELHENIFRDLPAGKSKNYPTGAGRENLPHLLPAPHGLLAGIQM